MQRETAPFPGVLGKDFTKEVIFKTLSRQKVYCMQNHEDTSKAHSVKGAVR